MSTISHIDHIAIVVFSIEQARSFYEKALGLSIEHVEEMPARGIRVAFIPVGQTRIELIEPLHDKSEVSKFLQTRGAGLHHIALKTGDIQATQEALRTCAIKLTYEQERVGAHHTKVNFVHPSSSGGVLVELVE